MVINIQQFELERVVNLLKAFGWSLVLSRFEGDKVHVEFEKVVKLEVG